MHQEIVKQVRQAAEELLAAASCRERDIFVVGCSSSEILGEKIGTHSSEEAAKAVLEGLYPVLKERGIYLAAQCCEHLNRALILEREAAAYYRLPICNVQPQPKAGGSFATAAYYSFQKPVAVEHIQAHAGIDIGDTFIGMHLKPVAVPIRLTTKTLGYAHICAARTRPKFIGGSRACYDETII